MAIFKFVIFVLVSLRYGALAGYSNNMSIHDGTFDSIACASPANNINELSYNATIQNSTDIRFCQSELTITQSWIVKGVSHVRISGSVVLNCINAGLLFESVTNLTISKVQLVNCGFLFTEDKTSTYASIFLIDILNLNISEVITLNSIGVGLFMRNVQGKAEISNSHFQHNITRYPDSDSLTTGPGVHLELAYGNNASTLTATDVNFVACHFKNTNRTQGRLYKQSGTLIATNQGGGLRVVLEQNTARNTINISHCTFTNLSAPYIGGVDILIRNNATANAIVISNCTFVNNTCRRCGGGGVRVQLDSNLHHEQPAGNHITINNSLFVQNLARYGGGVFLNTSNSYALTNNNSVTFSGCNWTKNGGRYGSAVYAIASAKESRSQLKTTFKNCNFIKNFIRKFHINSTQIYGQGTVCFKYFSATFEGETSFFRNVGTPLHLSSATVVYGTNSQNEFFRNIGINGGAITLLDSSTMYAKGGSVLNFTENMSYFKGGAIYFATIDSQDTLIEEKCFIQFLHGNDDSSSSMPRYIFKNNAAGIQFNQQDSLGKSVYASTLVPCNKQCGHYKVYSNYTAGISTSFDCVGVFVYENEHRKYEVATSAWIIEFLETAPNVTLVIPGKETCLPIKTIDEFNQTLFTVYKATLWNNTSTNTTAVVSSPYRYTHRTRTVLEGTPSDTILDLSLTTEHDREIKVTVKVKIVPCPPGYVLYNRKCKCSAELRRKQRYQGISGCNETTFQAVLRNGYWIGYKNKSDHESLISSICPFIFCWNSKEQSEYLLPMSFNATELDYLVCGESRTGTLCGKCRENRSAYYHSTSYKCGSNELCSFGWLFYSLSELLPVTLMFLAIIAFDVQLTAGSINGLILYYQLSNSMSIKADGFIYFSKDKYNLFKVHTFVSNVFELKNFFSTQKLSFCLWKGATTLDIIAFKYVTVIYSLLLVIVTISIMKTCGHRLSCKKLRMVPKNKKRLITNSVIHGLSGFFVLCYSQCATVSLMLLRPVMYLDPHNTTSNSRYVLYNGSMPYFGAQHIRYAIPALLFILTLVVLPPLVFLTYPLCYRVFRLLNIEETKISKLLCKLVPLEKFKPFFDSFQGSFKDKHRYTSGLYFLYRSVWVSLAVFTTHNSDLFYILLEVQLLVMIFIHSYCQPYKKTKHNRQDLFIFVNLAIINALTIFNFKRSILDTDKKSVHIASWIQIIMLHSPTIYVAIKISYFLFTVLRAHRSKGRPPSPDIEMLTERENIDDGEGFQNSYVGMNTGSSSDKL